MLLSDPGKREYIVQIKIYTAMEICFGKGGGGDRSKTNPGIIFKAHFPLLRRVLSSTLKN